MEYVKLIYNGRSYRYNGASNLKMDILGRFLMSDAWCFEPSFTQWAWDNAVQAIGGNITLLEKESGNVLLRDSDSQEKIPTETDIPLHEFIKLLDEWDKKVRKVRPQEVLITYQNKQCTIETQN